MFRRLLVPLDGTSEAAAALPAAATLARATRATITVVRISSARSDANSADAHLDSQMAQDEVRVAAEKLTASGVPADWSVRTPPVAEAIIQAANACDSDVIVMATHGRTGLARVFSGSVSERVVADCGRLVLLLAPDGQPLAQIETLLVPVDGTAGGALALGAAVGLARATGARLVLLDVVPALPLWMYGGVGMAPAMYIDPAWEDEAVRSARTYVEGLSAKLRDSGLQTTSQALKGDVAPSIRAVAEETNADLVVMSTHSLTGPARTVLGSVADAVVRTSHRPVLLVRRPVDAGDARDDTADTVDEIASLSPVG